MRKILAFSGVKDENHRSAPSARRAGKILELWTLKLVKEPGIGLSGISRSRVENKNMRKPVIVKITSFMLFICLLAPSAALAFGDGKKYFSQGMKHEVAQEWDKAAEAFAMAVTENPKNPEYRLHLQRVLDVGRLGEE